MTSERDVQRAIVEALVWDGWLIIRVNQGGRHEDETGRYVRFAFWQELGMNQQDSGISDVIAVKYITDGLQYLIGKENPKCVLLAIECKAPGKKKNVTVKQQAFLDAVTEHGGIAIVADCLEDVTPYLERAKVQ